MKRFLCLAVLAFAAALAPAAAQTARQERELAEIERKLKERRSEEARLKDEAKDREKEVAALRRRMIETADALQDAERRIKEIARETAKLQSEEAELEASLRVQQESLGDVLGALQTIERARPPALLVSPGDAAKAARTAMLLADVTPQIEARAAALKTSLTALNAVRATLEEERAAAVRTNEEIASRRSVLAELLAKKQGERRVAARLAAAAQSETAALAARATSLRDILGRLERLARVVAPRIKPPAPTHRLPGAPSPFRGAGKPEPFKPAHAFSAARGALKPPVVGNVIGRFGGRRPEGGRFEGLRFSASDKAIVTAPYEAKIAFARSWSPIGNLIVLDVGGGYHILLMGVGAFLVEEGQSVKAGEPVAAMAGANAELDLEIRKNGDPVNPSLWLSDNAGAEPAT
ncbi:MAG: peptidoglycan DD-metalloendopeptidase family protein [Parvularculaceae bacterium]|nr:peptidoglycan DD-metalloendopeptidase family protein [Parvularculaceae bacterium]